MDKNKPQLLLEAFRTKAGLEHNQCPSLLPSPPRSSEEDTDKWDFFHF